MDPITIVAAIVALGAGFGASTYVSKQKMGSAEAEASKEKQLADIRAQIESARAGLQANLDGFANDMASKILGRSL